MSGWGFEPMAFAGAAALLAFVVLSPLAALAAQLWAHGSTNTLASLFESARLWELLLRSVGLAGGVTAGALLLGVPAGLLLARTDVLGRRAAFLLHAFPAALPPFLLALGWFHWFGSEGLLGGEWTSRVLFGPVGVIATLSLGFAPIATALTLLGSFRADPALLDAARCVSSPLEVLGRIVLPLARPAIVLGGLVIFALSLSEIGVPMFLRVRTYPSALFVRLAGLDYDPAEAVVLLLPLLAIGALLLLLERRFAWGHAIASLDLRSLRADPLPMGRLRPWASVYVWALAVCSLLPLVAHLGIAGLEGMRESLGWLGDSVSTSILVSASAASALTGLGLFLGHALATFREGSRTIDQLAMLSFFMPSAALGVGLIGVWNRPQSAWVYASFAILVLGLMARYAAVGMRACGAVFGSAPASQEEAAAVFGAGPLRRLFGLLLPLHARGIGGVWLLLFVLCLRDLDTVVVFRPAGVSPLPVRLFTLEANGPREVIAALCVDQALLTLLALSAGGVLLSKGREP